ncbi:MAG: hypothetical protein ACXACY_30985 [Candidatus Hodarchaeales archaeon]|jgi:hypothetical protein
MYTTDELNQLDKIYHYMEELVLKVNIITTLDVLPELVDRMLKANTSYTSALIKGD